MLITWSAYNYFFLYRDLIPPWSQLFPYTTLFRSRGAGEYVATMEPRQMTGRTRLPGGEPRKASSAGHLPRSEEHTSELQSRFDLVCRLLLEKKNNHGEVIARDRRGALHVERVRSV